MPRARFTSWIVLCLLLMVPFLVSAEHVLPPSIKPIVYEGVRYIVPNDKGLCGYIEARDISTDRKLWTKTIFKHWYIPPFGTECLKYEWITSMTLAGNQLLITSERGRGYTLDLRTRAVHRVKKKALAESSAVNF